MRARGLCPVVAERRGLDAGRRDNAEWCAPAPSSAVGLHLPRQHSWTRLRFCVRRCDVVRPRPLSLRTGLAITVGAAVIVAVFFNVFEKTLLHVCLRLQGVHEGARRGAQPAAAAAGKEGGEIVGE